MASNWAIVIGINQYHFLQPLKYAKRDAEAMQNFLMQEAKFDRIFLFTDSSPPINGKPTEPFRANLLRVLRQIFATPFMKDGDNFWFFFSGHGIPHNGQDYLMPLDGDPEDIENTGISTNTITNYLRNCGADNAVMILDACRSGGKKSGEGIGRQTEAEARQTGVISLFSCSPNQYSYELEAITQGAFTYALMEGLGIRGRCATVERLNQYLEHRVPELVSQHLQRVKQTPYTIAEPLNRAHLILMPQHANLSDIATLKNDAYRAQTKQNWNLAQQLWIRVNAAASGQDMEAIEALQNLGSQRHTDTTSTQSGSRQASESSKALTNSKVDMHGANSTVQAPKNASNRSTPITPVTPTPLSKLSPDPVPTLDSSIPASRSPVSKLSSDDGNICSEPSGSSRITLLFIIQLLCAILVPPLGMLLSVGFRLQFWINIILTFLGWLPGSIHAIWIIYNIRKSSPVPANRSILAVVIEVTVVLLLIIYVGLFFYGAYSGLSATT